MQRSVLWRLKLRLQFTGWLQHLPTAVVGLAFLVASFIGWLTGRWPALFWFPLAVGVLSIIGMFKMLVAPPEVARGLGFG